MNWYNEPELTGRLSQQCNDCDGKLMFTSSLPSECRDSILNRSILSNISNVISRYLQSTIVVAIKRNIEHNSNGNDFIEIEPSII